MRQTFYLPPDKYPDEVAYIQGVKDLLPPGTSWAGVVVEVIRQAMQVDRQPQSPGGAWDVVMARLDAIDQRLERLATGPILLSTGTQGTEPAEEDLTDDAFQMEGFG